MLKKLVVCLIAGSGAGFGTGLAGLSAAAVIAPMLITFLHVNAYEAVGIALASDVLASAASAYTYKKNKNIDVKNGFIMLISVLLFTLVGSYMASFLPQTTMGGVSMFMTLLAGLKFIIRPVMEAKESNRNRSRKKAAIQSVICGVVVGVICGFVGAGGGGIIDFSILVMCIIFTLIGAMLTAKFANNASAKVMNRTLGFGLAAMSSVMIIINYVWK